MGLNDRRIDFGLLDDALLADRTRAKAVRDAFRTAQFSAIGPLVEYAYQQPSHENLLVPISDFDTPLVSAYEDAAGGTGLDPMSRSTALDPKSVEFSRIPQDAAQMRSAPWVAFVKRMERGVTATGFQKTNARGMAGALVELVDNVILHSEQPDSAIVGYRWDRQSFEFVVADAGVGVLASLRNNAAYARLTDHGDALRTALTDGESRFGPGEGHGYGFRQFFLALVHLRGSLRFRSGDHRLEIDEISPSLAAAQISQTSYFQGVMISVTCRAVESAKTP